MTERLRPDSWATTADFAGWATTADFAGVTHHMLLVPAPARDLGDAVQAAVEPRDARAFAISVHAPDVPSAAAALAALRRAGHGGAVDLLVQPTGRSDCAAVVWAAGGAGTVSEPAPGVSRLEYRGGTLVRVGHGERPPPSYRTAFDDLLGRLAPLGLALPDVWKTWSYLPSVPGDLAPSAEAFVEFNLIRTEVFGDTVFPLRASDEVGLGFPANTGVGEFTANTTLTGLAGRTAGDVRVHSVENRRQLAPFRYGPGTGRPRPAQFSRAVMLTDGSRGIGGSRGLVFVAGTAAVVGSDTVVADVAEQLDVTLGLVDGLLSGDAVTSDGLRLSGGLGALLSLNIYVATPAGLDVVRDELAGKLPVPAVCVLSPLTRPDLLVEVDGLAVVDLTPAGDRPSS